MELITNVIQGFSPCYKQIKKRTVWSVFLCFTFISIIIVQRDKLQDYDVYTTPAPELNKITDTAMSTDSKTKPQVTTELA